MHKISLLYNWFIWFSTFFFPDIPFIMRGRGWLYGLMFKKVGRNFQVSSAARILGSRNIEVGDNVFLALNVVLNSGGEIVLEDDVMVGIGSVIVAGNHTEVNGSYRFGDRMNKPIYVGKGSWIGANCTVLAGSYIPAGTLVAANAAVVGRLEQRGIWGGVPAKLIRSI